MCALTQRGESAPPILFLAPQKENGPCTVQEKKRFRGGIVCRVFRKVSARGVGGAGVWIFRTLPASFSACAAQQRQRGLEDRLSFNHQRQLPEYIRGGTRFKERERRAPVGDWRIGGSPLEQLPYLSELAPAAQVPRQAFFLLDGSTARSLFDTSKREWGVEMLPASWQRKDRPFGRSFSLYFFSRS